jgi:hypothetical protein
MAFIPDRFPGLKKGSVFGIVFRQPVGVAFMN